MELPKYEKGDTVLLEITVGHKVDDSFVADDITGMVGYYCWVYDRFKNVIAKFSKNDLTGRGFLRTIDVNDAAGKFRIKIPHSVTGAGETLTGEYFISVRTQKTIDDEPFLKSYSAVPRFELIEGVGNVFTSNMPVS